MPRKTKTTFPMAAFLQRLAEIRQEFGLKKKDFENAIRMKNTSRWGKTVFSVEQDTLQIIAETFDKSINWLLSPGPQIGGDQPPPEEISAEENPKTREEQLAENQRQEAENLRIRALQKRIVDLVLEFLADEPEEVNFDFLMRVWAGAREEFFHLPLKFISNAGGDEANPSSPS